MGAGASVSQDEVKAMPQYTILGGDAKFAELGRDRGWKLNSWQEPTTTPVWDVFNACWWLLDDQGNRTLTVQPDLV
jgi:hypothetical protein